MISLERGKSASISARIKPVDQKAPALKLGAKTPESVKLRREGDNYWLDITVGPVSDPGDHSLPVALESSDGNNLIVNVTVNTPAENLVASPRELDLGEVAIADVKSGEKRGGRLGIRKLVGTFQIKSISSTIDFLKLEQQTIIGGSNYLIRISVNPALALKAGAYNGKVRIETDEGQLMEVPVKITLR